MKTRLITNIIFQLVYDFSLGASYAYIYSSHPGDGPK